MAILLDFISVAVLSPSPISPTPPKYRALAMIALLALVLRGALNLTQPSLSTDDADGYLAHARLIEREHSFLGPYTLQPTAFRPPAYPLLLAAAMAIGLSDPAAVLLIHALCTLLCLMATARLSSQLSFSPRTTIFTTLCVAIDPLLMRYSLQPMTEVPCAAILTMSLALCVAGRQSQGSRTALLLIALSGLLLAFGALTRPTLLLLAVLLTLSLVPGRSLMNAPSFSKLAAAFRPALTFALAFVLGLSPWLIRNAVQFHAFIPATTHGGYTLALGNNEAFYRDVIRGKDTFPWDGSSLEQWQQASLQQATTEGVNVASERALDAWYYQLALRSIRQDPTSFFQACRLRIRRFWALAAADGASSLQNLMLTAWYGTLWTGLIVTALAELRRRKNSRFTPLWLSLATFCLMHIAYWTDARMRTPVMPVILILAIHGWSLLLTAAAGHHWFRHRFADPDVSPRR